MQQFSLQILVFLVHDIDLFSGDKYDLGVILGSGSFGQVRDCTLKSDSSQVRAVKMIEQVQHDSFSFSTSEL